MKTPYDELLMVFTTICTDTNTYLPLVIRQYYLTIWNHLFLRRLNCLRSNTFMRTVYQIEAYILTKYLDTRFPFLKGLL